mgnify:CR=1 FL=1
MDIGLLKAFIEIYRTKHFGHAANNLFISQSAISARIKQLEDELGTRLFTRDRNNIELTTAGKKFLSYADNILNTWSRAKQEIAIPDGVDALLNIAALPSIWDIFLEDWLSWVHSKNSAIALQTNVMSADNVIRNLLDGTLDLGFIFDPPKTPQLIVKELIAVPLIMVSSKPDISAVDAVKEDYIFVDWGTAFGIIHARQYPDISAPTLRASVGRLALGFLNNFGGAAYLPEAMVEEQLGKALFKVEDAPVIQKDAYAVYSQTSIKKEIIEDSLSWYDEH